MPDIDVHGLKAQIEDAAAALERLVAEANAIGGVFARVWTATTAPGDDGPPGGVVAVNVRVTLPAALSADSTVEEAAG